MAQDPLLVELREQSRWLRLLGLGTLRTLLPQLLKTEKQRLVYELSDGTRTVREIAAAAGVGIGTVSRLWTEWLAAGLCSESPRHAGRAERLVSLAALGMDVPNLAALVANAAAPAETVELQLVPQREEM